MGDRRICRVCPDRPELRHVKAGWDRVRPGEIPSCKREADPRQPSRFSQLKRQEHFRKPMTPSNVWFFLVHTPIWKLALAGLVILLIIFLIQFFWG